MIVGTPGNEMPCALELKLRFAHEPDSDRLGSNPARACRTRAEAASARKPAISTTGGAVSGEIPVACRTALAKESRTGVGVCARSEAALKSARISVISGLLADTMEIEIDVSVEVLGDVEAFRHAGRERLARDDGMHHGRHRELRRDRHVHRPELARLDTALEDAGHQPVATRHYFFVVEAGQLGKIVRFRHHQLRDADERRLADQAPVLAYEALEQLARAAGKRFEERLFVFEVEIDRAFGDAGATRDIFELRRGKAPIGEDLQRGADDLFRTGIFPAAPTRFYECTRHVGSQ